MTRSIEIPPRAAVLLESLRDVGYSLRTAVADIVDNSLTAGASRIELLAKTHVPSPVIGVLDNGIGLTRKELHEAMRLGSKNPREDRDTDDLGRFGLGLKTASFSQCRRLTVVTRSNGETACAVWDLDEVVRKDKWLVEFPDNLTGIPWVEQLGEEGTLVVWEKLDRLRDPDDESDRQDLVRQLDETEGHLASVFHRFLVAEGRHRAVKMFLNGGEIWPFDPFNSPHPATQRHPQERFRLNGKETLLSPVTLPHHDKVSEADWTTYGGAEGYTRNQGFYLYRNRRLIVRSTWFGLARQQELTKLLRIRIDISNDLDVEWKIDVKKSGAEPPPQMRKRLKALVERLGGASRRTFKRRGARLTDGNPLPVWTRSQDKNRILYGLDVEHPLLAGFLTRLNEEQASEFRKLLRLIALTLPVEALHVDVSADPKSVEQQPVDQKELEMLLKTMWEALRDSGCSAEKAKDSLRAIKSFQENWTKVTAMIQKIESEGQETK